MGVYEGLGVKVIIDARATTIVIGGSLMEPEALHAVRNASRSSVNVHELLRKAGERIAHPAGVEAAVGVAERLRELLRPQAG